MMEWLSNITDSLRSSLAAEVKRYKNREFMEATVASCAIVSMADGRLDPAEKRKMIQFMQLSDELKVFPIDEVISTFNKFITSFEFDFEIGKMEAMKYVSRLKDNPASARVMVRVCCILGAADGNFDDDEKRAVGEICQALNIPSKEFGLPF